MLSRVLRLSVAASLGVGLLVVLATGAAGPASAAVPLGPTFTQTAARSYGTGGPAQLVPVDAQVLTTAPDGSALYYDATANRIRRVDASTGIVSPVAGNGTLTTDGVLDTTDPATAAPLPSIRGLWTDAAGDIFAWACGGQNCTWGQGLYRLDASTGRWGLAVSNTEATFPYRVLYTGFAVTPAGDVIAVDSAHFVIRQITAGADPASSGTVVAGTLGTAGVSGDGGPATSATIAPSGPVAVSSSGDIFFADGGYPVNVRRVDPDGAISSVSDPTASSAGSGVQPSVVALAVSQDAATLYVLRYTPSGQEVVRADPVGGPDPYTVAGPSAVCDSGSQDCLGSSLTEAPDSGVASVLVAGWGASRASRPTARIRWPITATPACRMTRRVSARPTEHLWMRHSSVRSTTSQWPRPVRSRWPPSTESAPSPG